MRVLGLLLVCAGCLDLEPGTPTGPTDTPDLATKPSNPAMPMPDMAKPVMTTPHDMAAPPGSDLAMPPPAPLGNLICEATLSLTGTYVQGTAPAADFPGGCWPDGSWTFTATVTTNGCSTAPPLQASYKFTVTEDMDFNDTITYTNDPTNMYVSSKISGGEGGVCVGAFKIFSADGKSITNLRPAMQADKSINGAGDFRVYDADQRN